MARRCCAGGARGAAQAARPRAPSPTCSARSTSRRRPSGAPGCCSSSGIAEALTYGPAAIEHLREAYDVLDDPLRRALAAGMLARDADVHRRPRRGGRGRRGARPRELPRRARGPAPGARGGRAHSRALRRASRRTSTRLRAEPAGELGDGARREDARGRGGARAGTHGGGPRERVRRARAARARRRRAARGGQRRFFSMRRDHRARARRPSRGAARSGRTRSRDAHRRGSLFSLLGDRPLARASRSPPRRAAPRPRQSLRDGARRSSRAVGLRPLRRVLLLATRSWRSRCSSAATSTARASASATRAAARRPPPTAPRYWLHHRGLAARARRGPRRGGARHGRATSRALRAAFAQPGVRARGARCKAEALDRLGRARRGASRSPRRSSSSRARWGAPGALGRALRVLGTLAARGRPRPTCEEARRGARRARPPGSSTRKALAALGAALRRGRRPTDAREPLRRALELADAAAPTALAEHVRARALRDRRPAAHDGAQRRRLADRERAARRRLAAERPDQPRHRPGALRDAEDRRGPPLERLPQARHPLAPRARPPSRRRHSRCRGRRRKDRVGVGGALDAPAPRRPILAHAHHRVTRPQNSSTTSRPGRHRHGRGLRHLPPGLQPPSTSARPDDPRRRRRRRRRSSATPATRPAGRAAAHRPQRRPARRPRGQLLLKTDALQGVEIDPAARTPASAPAPWETSSAAPPTLGLAALHGSTPDVSVVGYSLGGGIGWYGRKHGSPRTASPRSSSSPPTASCAASTPTTSPSSSGRCAAAAATSASSPRSSSTCSRSPRSTRAPCSSRSSGPARCCTPGASGHGRCPRRSPRSGGMLQFPPIPNLPELLRGQSFALVEAAFLGNEADGAELMRRCASSARPWTLRWSRRRPRLPAHGPAQPGSLREQQPVPHRTS